MPVSDVRVPDGRIFQISHPEGATQEEIFSFANYQYLKFEEPEERPQVVSEPTVEEEETGLFDDITEFGQRTVGSAARILGQAPAGLQSLFRDGFEEDEELVERNRAIEESVRTGLGYDEEYDDSTLGLAADVTGSVLGFGGAAVTGAAIGSFVPGVGTLLGGIIGAGTGMLLGAGSNVASGMEETARQIESGRIVNDEDYEAASTRLAAIGASEGLPFIGPAFKVMRRITGSAAKNPKAVEKLGDYIRSAAIQGTEEAAQEALAGIASDAVLKEYINPDIEIGDSLAVDIVAGGTAGALFDVGINLATRRRRGLSDTEEDPVEPLREERIAEETILRENIENAEAARRERASQLASVGPAPTQEPVILPELLDISGIIVEPTRQEVMAMEKDRAGEDLSREERDLIRGYNQRVPTADSYKGMARTVVQKMGDSFPVEAEFYIEEDIDGQPGMVAIKDGNGNTYGRPVPEGMRLKLQPAVAALNGQTVEENIFQSNRSVIADSKEDYSPEQVSTLQRVGRIALGPESLSYTSEAADYAGGTTVEKGFTPQLSAEKVIEANIPRKKQTISQRINVRRIKEGKVPSNRFAISEIRREIGKDVGRLAEYEAGAFRVDTYAALPNQVNGKFAVQPMSLNVDGRLEPSGDLIFDRPSTAAERQAAREAGKPARKRVQFASAAEAFEFARDANSRKGGSYIPSKELMGDPEFGVDKIQEILDRKNISSPLNSPEIKNLAARFTGRKLRRDQSVSDLTASERQLFYQKLRQLPRFSSPTNIPLFKLRPKKEPAPVVEEQVEGEALALPSPTTPEGMDAATKGMLQRAMEKRLKQLGLTEVTPVVTNLINNVERDVDGNVYFKGLADAERELDVQSQGGYSIDGAKVVQVAVDAIMAQSPKADNIEAAVVDVLNHEVVHALREIDLITQSELQLLERLSTRYKKVDTDQTYLEWATQTYTDPNNPEKSLNPVAVSEEAIAEMIRDAVTGRIIIDNKPAKLAGKPRSIINKIVKFFKGLVSTATEVDPDYTSFTQFMNDLEAGRIGERERGVVRTLYRLERGTGRFIDRRGVVDGIQVRTDEGDALYSATVDTPTGRTVIETDDPEFTERSARTLAEQGEARRSPVEVDALMQDAELDSLMFNRITFGRKTADRNVINSSQDQLDGVIEYAADNKPDDIGMATLRAGPMANSINSGFADQNGAYTSFTTPPPKSFLKKVLFEVQDKLIDLKAIEDSINAARAAAGLPRLRASESAYIGEETLAGKIAAFDRSFTEKELKPLLEEMTEKEVTLDQMDEFLVLRHAIERNARVRKINPSMPDAGSGKWNRVELTDAYVKRKMLADYGMTWNDAKGEWVGGNDRSKVMSALAGKIDKMNSTTLAISQKGGLITEQERALLDGYFKYYTPLRGISQEEDIAAESDARTAGSGGSLSVVGKEVKRMMGRGTEAISPFATIVSERGTQTARAVKNTSFGKRLVDLIEQNPNDEVWELVSPDDPRYRRAFDTSYTYVGPDASRYGERKTDISGETDKKNWVKKVRVIKDPIMNPTGQGLLGVKVDGVQYFVDFKNPDLQKAVLNLDAQTTKRIIERLNGITRFMSYVNTSLNPEFVMGNFPRDVETAVMNILAEQSMVGGKAVDAKGIISKVLKRTIPSIGVFYRGMRDPSKLSAEDARDFNEFIKTGAKTDWFHSKDPEDQKKNIQSMMEMASGTFAGNAKQGLRATLDFIDDYNSAVENGIRLSTFVAARDAMIEKGIPRNEAVQEAATLAKNLTVNFNRKGNSGQLLNGLYLFFNASVQGTVNTVRGLNVFSKDSSRFKQGMVGGIMGFGALTTAIAQSILGEDEYEKIPEYIRDRNLIIPTALWGGDSKKYSTIPLPYGYNVFHNIGENTYLVANGNISPEKAAVRATNVFLGSFNPLGTSSSETFLGSIGKTIVPQVGKPLAELMLNENYFGSPIYPPDNPFGGAQEPLSRRSFRSTSQIWKTLSEGMSELTGGNESEPGFIEMPPTAFSYLTGFILGGAGSFAERTFFKLPEAIIDPTRDPELKDIPFVRRVYGEITEGANTEKYYERRQTLQQKDRQANDVLTGSERAKYRRENNEYIRMLPVLKATEKRLRALRKAQKQIRAQMENATPSRAIELAEREQVIQKRIDDTMNRFNSRYSDRVGKAK